MSSKSNPLADLLGLSEEESGRIFDKAAAASDPEPELAPETRVVTLRFPTDTQKTRAIARIRDTGVLRVRIQVD